MPLAPRRTRSTGARWSKFFFLALCAGALPAQENSDCLLCHGDEELIVEQTKSRKAFFDEERAAHGVHGSVDCISCHVDLDGVEDFPHAAKLEPAACGDCHLEEFESMAAYWEGSHGRLVREGNANAPRCGDCHGNHYILKRTDPNSRAFALNVPAVCTQCHVEGEEVHRNGQDLSRDELAERYKDRIHGSKFFSQGLIVTAICTSCHGAHGVRPASDPKSSIHKDNVNAVCATCHGDSKAVHRGIIAEELWEEPGTVPICVDCHIPHAERRVAYGTNMSDGECLACHGQQSIVEETGKASLLVDVETYRSSVHGRRLIACAMCHTWVMRSENRSCATEREKANCSMCHEDAVTLYERGTHGQLRAQGDANAPGCVDCHGAHSVMESSLDQPERATEALRARVLDSPTHRRNVPDLCASCHREGAPAAMRHPGSDAQKVAHYRQSIHGKGLIDSGLIASANCVDCHSPHMELPPDDPDSTVSPQNLVATCGKCHDGIYEEFRTSVHSPEGNPDYVAGEGQPGLPHCNECHSAHSVARTDLAGFKSDIVTQCGNCHERLTETYFDTYHGKVSALGDTLVARCHDCHGAHGMLAVDDPNSTLAPANAVATCAQCHPASHPGFTEYLAHATHDDPERYPALYWAFFAMTILLVGVFGFFGLHVIAWLPRSWALRREHSESLAHADTRRRREFVRFDPFNRMLHVMIIVSFLGLTLTGMALKFADTGWAKVLAGLMGGPATAGWFHRVCAVITFGYFGLHIFDVVRRFRRRKTTVRDFFFGPNTMVPTWRDVRDFVGTAKWFVGMGPRPRYGQWTYWEKFDYFAVFWGVAIIGFSGLILWFPELFTRVFPGWAINVATIIHSEEALLAAGFIFSIHFFNTHLRPEKFPMDRVVFTGQMTVDELKVDKPELYDHLVATGELEKYLAEPASPTARRVAYTFGFTALAIGIITIVLIVHGLLTVGL